jgi:cob(I)alamin adenosyltransferase
MREQLAKARIDAERIAELEHAIDDCERELEPLRSFIIPAARPRPRRCTWRARSAAAPSGAW